MVTVTDYGFNTDMYPFISVFHWLTEVQKTE